MHSALAGTFVLVLIASALLALGASLWLLARYRRAVVSGMHAQVGVDLSVPTAQGRVPPMPLEIERLSASPGAAVLPGPGRAARCYLFAGLGYAITMSLAVFASERFASEPHNLSPLAVAFLCWLYLWPVVLAVNLVAALDRAYRLRSVAMYLVVGLALIAGAASTTGAGDVGGLVVSWLIFNGLPTLLLGGFLMRRVRAAGPLMLALSLPAVLGSQVALSILDSSDAGLRTVVVVGDLIGFGAIELLLATMAFGLVIFGLVAWVGLRRLGMGYVRQRFSDEMLTLDAMWLVFSLSQAIQLAVVHWAWWLAGPAAFVVYKVLARWSLSRLPDADRPKTLLLLRVFALGSRSALLFDALRRRWLRGGPITMIAGPDLVTSAVEPHEFLDFLGGRLGRRYVSGKADLADRIGRMPTHPDPDARYRVHEYLCRADTWQFTVQHLLARSDAVLMDLRGFSPANQGCVYEIGRLLDALPLQRVVFAIDAATDTIYLEKTLRELWQVLAADSPNRLAARPAARCFELQGPSAAELESLVVHLLSPKRRANLASIGVETTVRDVSRP